ncbi:MAG TPA: response regulator [Candidatus Faecousia intestinigallinarum]|nr:response regulator [Candidatus Faecousia intestinigallinarum]
MEMLRLLIADGSEEFCEILAEQVRREYYFKTCREGREALSLLRSFQPDILVLDMMLPGLDGVSLLQQAASTGHKPMVLATTRFVSSYVVEAVQRLEVGYLMVKPCDVQALIQRLQDLSRRLKTPVFTLAEPRTTVSNMLLRLGVSTKLRGYCFLREAVMLMAKDPAQSVTKELYPAVAALCDGNPKQVERAIRSAIHSAWAARDEKIWGQLFPPDSDGNIPRPTNAAFISMLADMLTLEETEGQCG